MVLVGETKWRLSGKSTFKRKTYSSMKRVGQVVAVGLGQTKVGYSLRHSLLRTTD